MTINNQKGFTIIELLTVLIIVGILSAIALPKFVGLKGEAQASALLANKQAIETGSIVNDGMRQIDSLQGQTTLSLSCNDAAALVLTNGLPTGYSLDTKNSLAAGDNVCTLSLAGYTPTVTLNIIGIK